MPRQTAAEKKAERELVEKERLREKEKFQQTIPLRLLELVAKANLRCDIRAVVYRPEGGELRVSFYYDPDDYRDTCREDSASVNLSLTSEEWEIEGVEEKFAELEAADRERERIRQIAKNAYEKLTEEERSALNLRPVH